MTAAPLESVALGVVRCGLMSVSGPSASTVMRSSVDSANVGGLAGAVPPALNVAE